MPAPLIEFSKFSHPHQWLLRRGPPPWLDTDRWWVRAFRVSLVLSIAAGLATLLQIGSLLLVNQAIVSLGVGWLILLIQGAWFGGAVVLPLSRWLKRSMVSSILGMPFCCVSWWFAWISGQVVAQAMEFDFSKSSEAAVPMTLSCGFIGGILLSLWIGDPERQPRLLYWFSGGLSGAIACLAGELIYLASYPRLQFIEARLFPDLKGVALMLLVQQSVFHHALAVVLGRRLWYRSDVQTCQEL